MPLGRLVPWHSWEEWHQVRLGLFSANRAERQFAIDRVRGTLQLAAGGGLEDRPLMDVCMPALRPWSSSMPDKEVM